MFNMTGREIIDYAVIISVVCFVVALILALVLKYKKNIEPEKYTKMQDAANSLNSIGIVVLLIGFAWSKYKISAAKSTFENLLASY
jgi:hypothetical protein